MFRDDLLPTSVPDTRGRLGAPDDGSAALVRQMVHHCAAYREAQTTTAAWQLANTLIPYMVLIAACVWAATAPQGWWLVLLASIPAGGLLVRLFIIQHDCGHGSFLPSRVLNDRLGLMLSVFTVTPFRAWKRAHALHHASAGDLSRRGVGDVETLTLREYVALSRFGRLRYRLYRHPVLLIVLGSPLNFLLLQRLPFGMGLPWRSAWVEVTILNAALAAVFSALALLVGNPGTVLLGVLPSIVVASWVGGWLFYVQHQYEETVWDRGEDWNLHQAALGGSSYYVLPRVLQWFTGNVGLHHVHHLNSRIPNYRLQECLDGHETLGKIGRLTLRDSLACVHLALWDEETRKLIRFSQVRV